jgi:hypothetical protein
MIQVIFKLRRTFERAARYEPAMRPPDFFVGVGGYVKDQMYRSVSSYHEFLIKCKDCKRRCLVKMGYQYTKKLKIALGKCLIELFYIFAALFTSEI